MIDYFWTGSKKGRGRAAKSIKLIEAMAEIAEECAPITVRGVCYKLFTRGLIASMGQGDIKATASRKASSATSQTPTSGGSGCEITSHGRIGPPWRLW